MSQFAPLSQQQSGHSRLYVKLIKDSLLVVFISLIIFTPISGVLLKGFSFETHLLRPIYLALFLGVSKFLFGLIKISGFTTLIPHQHMSERLYAAVENRRVTLLLVAGVGAFIAPFLVGNYWLSVMVLTLIYILLGLGLNIVVGMAGLLDLGFVAFYAVGAYTFALGHEYLGMGFWTALPLAAILAGLFGTILAFPVLRMHGDYLAIVTLGFGEIIRLVLNNWLEFTGGPNGVSAPLPTLFGIEFSRRAKYGGTTFHELLGIDYSSSYKNIFIYLILLLVVAVILFFVSRLKTMPMGRAWEALREDEIACRSLGINHVNVKLSAFAMGAMIGGIAGVFFAAQYGFINPTSFTFFESALILAIVVLGGMGSTLGVTLAAIVVTLLPEILRDFEDFRVLTFGLLMVLMMIWRPRGLIRAKRQMFRLQEG